MKKKYVLGKKIIKNKIKITFFYIIRFRPRLKTFENLAKVKEASGSKFKLYEDILSIKKEDIYLYDLYQLKDQTSTSRNRFMTA
jgi:hypothetical protein